ncbi:hypothetical protein CR513_53598, partial [Mucuna pruriens]
MDRSMIDAASGGALMDKMPTAARHLISNMASNTQQFGIRGANQLRMVNEIATISARTESRAICSSGSRIHTECASKTNRLSTTDPTISSTLIPTTAAIENSTLISGMPTRSRQRLSRFGLGRDESNTVSVEQKLGHNRDGLTRFRTDAMESD